jgi:acyl-CoA synthetase (AMP-forming)/AMP-acid ligase II
VVITHGNLITNQMQIQEGFGHDHTTKFVGWLPLFHDMGLVGNVLQPVFLGIESILMPPLSFVQRPLRWLRAISQYRATTSGAPNFAFEHCVGRIPVDEVPALDLSCWRVAFNGSEPVRGSTLRNFAAKFEKAGFSLDRFLPCYGLAEATLFASGRKTTPIPTLLCFLRSELEKGRAQPVGYSDERDVLEVVSCGKPAISQEVQVVDPETHRCLEEGGVGEIWISGPNVAYGYFGDDPTSVRTFQASLPGETRKYLRTGDLGFLLAGELYISGRIKDVMIIRGRNIYPHDVEQVVNGKHSLFLANRCVAFTLSGESGERLIIAQEISRRFPNSAEAASILDGIHADVIRHFDVIAENILFVTPGTLATTSSGKLQRHAVRQDYLNGKCEALYARSSTRQTT